MALVLEANYSKKLGLPGYSSHQYSITVRKELSDVKQVDAESRQLYELLQSCVDREIQSTGFLPDRPHNGNGYHAGNGHGHVGVNGHSAAEAIGHANGHGVAEAWNCSPKEKELILSLAKERSLSKAEVEQLSIKLFNVGVRGLNKLQASGLIDERKVEAAPPQQPTPPPPPLPLPALAQPALRITRPSANRQTRGSSPRTSVRVVATGASEQRRTGA